MTRTLFIAVLFALLFGAIATAQTSSGQVCIGAFEDRNGNGIEDPSEPPITRGLNIALSDASGVIIETARMENSPNASSGTLCFQRLPEGQYTLRVTSANYQATTASIFDTTASTTGVVTVLPYGAQVIPDDVATTSDDGLSEEERLRSLLVRLLIAGLGALVIMGAMAVVGALIYFFVLRNRNQPPPQNPYQPSTGQYPSVPATGQYQAAPTPQTPSSTPVVPATDDDMPAVVTQQDTYDMYSDDDDDTNKPTQAMPRDPYADVPDDDFSFEDDDDSPYRPPQD